MIAGLLSRSISRKLTLIIVLVSGAALVLMSGAFVANEYRSVRQGQIRNLSSLAEVLGANATAALTFGDRTSATETLSALEEIQSVLCAGIYDEEGYLFSFYTRRDAIGPPSLEMRSEPEHRVERGRLHLYRPIDLRGETIGAIYLQSDLGAEAGLLHQSLRLVAVWLVGAILLTLILSATMQKLVSRPLLRLAETARVVSQQGDYNLRAEAGGSDEIGTLIDCFNQMLAQIQQRDFELESHRNHLEEEVERRTSELTRTNAELREATLRAEAAAQARGQFLANMSHEIRTPMNAILGLTELALETQLNNEQRDYLEMVRTSAEGLLTIINDILDLSKIEAGKLSLDPRVFSLRECLEKTLKGLSLRAQQKKLELVCHIRPDVPDRFFGDDLRLQQVVVNLVGNAIKFTDSGEVMLLAQLESASRTHAIVQISVKDTGIGIASEKQQAIFEAFAQADGSTTRRYGGTGLGLAISAQLVSLMGGKILVNSQENAGSTFHLSLPLEMVPDRQAGPVHPLEGAAVLVAEDNPSAQAALVELINHWGAAVETVSEAGALVDVLEKTRGDGEEPPILVLDSDLAREGEGPVLSELDLRGLRPRRLVLLVPTLASTLEAGGADRGGASACLLKPAGSTELQQALLAARDSLRTAPTPAAPARQGPAAAPSEPRRLRILLAEDNPINQRLAVLLLKKRGYQVVVAGDGKAAVEACRHGTFDAVLMDLHMPEMGGIEATEAIRQLEQGSGRRIPVIALTADAMKGVAEECLAAGMDGYLAKPLRAEELYTLVESFAGTGPGDLEGGWGAREAA